MADDKFTWADLKKFVNEIPDEFLDGDVIWWGDERGGKIKFVHQLEEDYVRTDEGCEPKSVQEPVEDGEEEYPVIFIKGTPILDTD